MLAEWLRAGLGGDSPVTRLRPAFDPAQVSLLGRLGCFGFSVPKEPSTAQSQAGLEPGPSGQWMARGAAAIQGNQLREGDSGAACPPQHPPQEAHGSPALCSPGLFTP